MMTKLNLSILSAGIVAVAGMRVLMAPYPNIEPIMTFVIATALVYGPLAGFTLGAGAMLFSDFFLPFGPWTLYDSLTYGLVGLLAGYAGRIKKNWGKEPVLSKAYAFTTAYATALAFVLTLFYDLVTAGCWALMTMTPLAAVYAAQIPFTLLHLSNCGFSYLLVPVLMKIYAAADEPSTQKLLRKTILRT